MNPFKYGTVVEKDNFINRTQEISHIKDDLLNGSNIILYAPRRYGKTSLMLEILKQLKQQDVFTIYLDLFQVYSVESFIRLYASKVMETKDFSIKKVLTGLKSSIRGIIPSVTVDDAGKPVITASYDANIPKEYTLLDVLELPRKMKKKEEKWVIVFDEFQEITRLNGDTIEKQFRSVLQMHQDISYVMMGSKTHLLLNMFADKRRAFYNIGKLQKLSKIPAREMLEFMQSQFEEGHIPFEQGIFETIIQYTDNIPYYNQYLAFQVWQLARAEHKTVDRQLVDRAVQRILDNQADYYYTLIDQLTALQRNVLQAFLIERENIYSQEYVRKHNLSSVSGIQRSINRLIELDIVEKVESNLSFSDPFFPLYLQSRIS